MISSLRNNARSRATIFHTKALTLGKTVFKLKKRTPHEIKEAYRRVAEAKMAEHRAAVVVFLMLILVGGLIYLFFTS